MGRSGSSALTRVLSLCGAALPEALLPANNSNPRGHWEPLEALNLNEDVLLRHSSGWHDPTFALCEDNEFSGQESNLFIEHIMQFLRTLNKERITVVKEPRIVALSNFWFTAAQKSGFAIKIVIPVRHPHEIVASLAARDGISAELSAVLWMKYNLLAERLSRPFPRVFVEYSNLLSDWRREIARIADTLAINLDADLTKIEVFLDRALHHQKESGAITEFFITPWISEVHTAFAGAARDIPLDTAAIDRIFDVYSGCERTFRHSRNEFVRRFKHKSGVPGRNVS